MSKYKIAIFASGSGSNALKLMEHFQNSKFAEVVLVLSNNPKAGVIDKARDMNTLAVIFSKKSFTETSKVVDLLKSQGVDIIVLAGFLWLIPEGLVKAFPDRIINIHPALLPGYGGKGMWGHHVHEAVLANKEKYSGITIHLVNEEYDKGRPLFQEKVDISHCKTADEIGVEVLKLEHQHFSKVVQAYLESL